MNRLALYLLASAPQMMRWLSASYGWPVILQLEGLRLVENESLDFLHCMPEVSRDVPLLVQGFTRLTRFERCTNWVRHELTSPRTGPALEGLREYAIGRHFLHQVTYDTLLMRAGHGRTAKWLTVHQTRARANGPRAAAWLARAHGTLMTQADAISHPSADPALRPGSWKTSSWLLRCAPNQRRELRVQMRCPRRVPFMACFMADLMVAKPLAPPRLAATGPATPAIGAARCFRRWCVRIRSNFAAVRLRTSGAPGVVYERGALHRLVDARLYES